VSITGESECKAHVIARLSERLNGLGSPSDRIVESVLHHRHPGGHDQRICSIERRIVGAGFEGDLEPFDAPWDSRHCRILDPDGNAIDLFAPLP
jgi:hypothetical protein